MRLTLLILLALFVNFGNLYQMRIEVVDLIQDVKITHFCEYMLIRIYVICLQMILQNVYQILSVACTEQIFSYCQAAL